MGFFFSCYGCSYSGHFQIIHWHSCSAGQEQMFSAYPPLFLKQEDAYFGSCGGCYMQGKKVFMADFSFPHLHRDSCFSPSPGQRWELWTAFRKCLCTNTHTYLVSCFFMRTVTSSVHRPHMLLTLKTKIKKTIQVTISSETYRLGQSDITVSMWIWKINTDSFFFYGYKLEIHVVIERGTEMMPNSHCIWLTFMSLYYLQ